MRGAMLDELVPPNTPRALILVLAPPLDATSPALSDANSELGNAVSPKTSSTSNLSLVDFKFRCEGLIRVLQRGQSVIGWVFEL